MTEPMTAERLAEIAAREAAATKGPWGIYDDGTGRIDIAADLEDTGHGYICRRGIAQTEDEPIDNDPDHASWDADTDLEQIKDDAAFIAHAREDVPALLARIAELEAERHTTNEALSDAAEALREKEQRLTELDQNVQKLVDGWKQASDEHAAYAKSEVMADMPGMSDKQEGRSLQLLDCADELAHVLKGENPDDWEYGIGLDVIDRDERTAEAGESK